MIPRLRPQPPRDFGENFSEVSLSDIHKNHKLDYHKLDHITYGKNNTCLISLVSCSRPPLVTAGDLSW